MIELRQPYLSVYTACYKYSIDIIIPCLHFVYTVHCDVLENLSKSKMKGLNRHTSESRKLREQFVVVFWGLGGYFSAEEIIRFLSDM